MLTPIRSEACSRTLPTSPPRAVSSPAASSSFADVLTAAVDQQSGVRFSAHARDRMAQRGIAFSEDETARIGRALDAAAAKGGRSSLVILDQCALVASVPNRTVITVAPVQELGEAVFTNIDSAVVASSDKSASTSSNRLDPMREAARSPIDRSGLL